MSHIAQISRPEKLKIARQIRDNLAARQNQGPAEPGLDAFVSELSEVSVRLDVHVAGRVTTSTAWQMQLARVDSADVGVDTWLRHVEGFVFVEANRKEGPHAGDCKALYAAACPDGLAHVDDRVEEENAVCRTMLSVLRDPANAPLLEAIEFPMVWLDWFDAAISESEAAVDALIGARTGRSTHVVLGRDAEAEWVDVMLRLRDYVNSRAGRRDVAKQAEGRTLLQPLLAAAQRLRVEAATRATRKVKAAEEPAGGAGDPSNGGANPSNGGANPSNGGANPSNGGANPSNGGANPSNGGGNPSTSGANPSTSGANPSTSGANPSNGGANPSNGGGEPSKGAGAPQPSLQ